MEDWEEQTSRVSVADSVVFLTLGTDASLCGDVEMTVDGRGDGVDADATATLTAPPEHKTSFRRAGECAAPALTVDAGAVEGRSGDTGATITGAIFLGEVGEATSGCWLLSDGVVALCANGWCVNRVGTRSRRRTLNSKRTQKVSKKRKNR